jgi:hypothetical protein
MTFRVPAAGGHAIFRKAEEAGQGTQCDGEAQNHLHHKQLADSMDSEKTCTILGDLLAGRLLESNSAAKATFPTLISPGNGTALNVKCVEDGFEAECGQRGGKTPTPLLSRIRSVLPILLCQMALPQRVLRRLDSIALTESRAHQKVHSSHDNTRRPHTSSGRGREGWAQGHHPRGYKHKCL